MARDAATYRGARRNYCIRDQHMVWGPNWYYAGHDYAGMTKANRYRTETRLSKTPSRYHPLAEVGAFLKSKGKQWGRRIGKIAAGAPRARSAGRGS